MDAKRQARRILTEVFSQGRTELIEELLTEDFVNHNAPPGLPKGASGVRRVVEMERRGIPDLQYEILREIEEGDLVVQHVTVRGTHLGPLFGVAPTGRRVEWNEIHIARMRDGRCAEHWGCNDMASLWVQLGRVDPVAAGAV